jgi:hypothetical protein
MDRPYRIYRWLALGITWGAGGVALLTGCIRSGAAQLLHPLNYLAAFGPSIAGFIMAAATGGWAGVRQLLARLVPTRESEPWYAAPLFLVNSLALSVLMTGLHPRTGGDLLLRYKRFSGDTRGCAVPFRRRASFSEAQRRHTVGSVELMTLSSGGHTPPRIAVS